MKLKRYPIRKNELLQAWDAADTLLLAHLAEQSLATKRVVILNDSFGALSCGVAPLLEASGGLTTYTDSFVSSKAILLNSQEKIRHVHDRYSLHGHYDWALMRIPKNLSFFEEELAHLSHHLTMGSRFVCGAMIKHLPKSAFDLVARYIGPTQTSLAEKKARLIFAEFQKAPAPLPRAIHVQVEGFDLPFSNGSNLFSREKLDIGTRFLLGHIPEASAYQTILDLGCGNGILGIALKKRNPKARIIFSDESAMAIQSARLNYKTHFSDEATFVWTHSFEDGTPKSVDLVLCNPPFHHGHTLADATARQMFADAHRVLKAGGTLRVVGNSHLRYPSILRQVFGAAEVVATHAKFVIVDAVKVDGATAPRLAD